MQVTSWSLLHLFSQIGALEEVSWIQVVLGTASSPFFPITSFGPFCLSSHLQLVNLAVAVSLLLNQLFLLYVKQGPRECQAQPSRRVARLQEPDSTKWMDLGSGGEAHGRFKVGSLMAGSDLTVEGGHRNISHNLLSLLSSYLDQITQSFFPRSLMPKGRAKFSSLIQAVRYKLLRLLMTVFLPCRPGK